MSGVDWYIYILRCADRSLYTGIAKDVPGRVIQHNKGRGAKYTKARLPVELVYTEKAGDRGSALRREHQIKRLRSTGKRRLIANSLCGVEQPGERPGSPPQHADADRRQKP